MTTDEVAEVRSTPLYWFQGFARYRNEETRKPTRGKANVLQRRVFEHYRRCQEENKPCRIVVCKYRRAGSSTSGNALIHLGTQNYTWRQAVIGTDYKASSNMLEMVKFFGEHDDFPGWRVNLKATAETHVEASEWSTEILPLSERVDRSIATRLEYSHGSSVELYTAKNPESARSAGLNGYLATECGRWASGGAQDAGETLTAMRNTLPKRGFHFAMEESTANGAQGAFYETCRNARWPDYADWWKQWESVWQLQEAEFGKDLQFVFIFAAWYEDERHVPEDPLTPEQEERIRSSLDEDEKQLIARHQQDGPRGPRLGGEVDATVWEQLAWRRSIIRNVCTKGGSEEFKVEYPSNPQEAFRSSGSPALDMDGVMVLENMARTANTEYGFLTKQNNGAVTWSGCAKDQAIFHRWEEPIEPAGDYGRGCRYLISCDPMSGADQVTSGAKDRHGVFCIRDAYTDQRGTYYMPKVVARIKPPCQWEDEVLTKQLVLLGMYYGGATIVVESNAGAAILKALQNDHQYPNIYQREVLDSITQKTTKKLGWLTTEPSKRIVIATLQKYVREEMFELLCLHAVGELLTLIVDNKGRVRASGSNHDDDAMSLAIALECLHAAHEYPRPPRVRREDPNDRVWK